MKTAEVPQQPSCTHVGVRKLLYAVDEQGEYRAVKSAGWEVETYATVAAIDEFNRLRDEAWAAARAGLASPLAYHMYHGRMDPPALAAAAGVWRWRLRRHLRKAPFERLSERLLVRYGEALGLPIELLRHLPEKPGG